MKLKRYRHKKARFCVLTSSFCVPKVGESLRKIYYFDTSKNEDDDVIIQYTRIRRTYIIKEKINLYDGLFLAVTPNCLYIYYSIKDKKKFEMVAVKDVPVKDGKTRFVKPYMEFDFNWDIRHTTGFETGSFVAEEVDSTFARYNMYIVKSGEKIFLCTKI